MAEIIDIKISGNVGIGKSAIARIIYDALAIQNIVCLGANEEVIPRTNDTSHLNRGELVCIIHEEIDIKGIK